MTDQEYCQAIDRARASSAVRRASAWARVPERVLGLPLRPVTPATFDLLHGTRNAFVCGLPPVVADVTNFIRFHSPAFDPDAPAQAPWRHFRISLRITHALCPVWTPPARREATRAGRFLQAVQDIRAILDETWADALPPGDDSDSGPKLAASLHAQLSDMFARDYNHWPHPLPLRHTPLPQLFQLARCADRHHHGPHALYFDRAEAAIHRAYLAPNAKAELAAAARVTPVAP